MTHPRTGGGGESVKLRFFLPSAPLRRYVTTYYLMEIELPDGEFVEDFLHPEWANLRIVAEGSIEACFGDAEPQTLPRSIATGPTSRSARFRAARGHFWGIGLLPLGWARFVDAPADEFADRTCDAAGDPAFASFRPLVEAIGAGPVDVAGRARTIDEFMLGLLEVMPARDEQRIVEFNQALLNCESGNVGELGRITGIPVRSLERLAKQVFGFPPKLLLRRQRFLRSLAQYMLDPSLSWLNALDWQYHDQAHFTRDFQRFMAMSPRKYAALDHPVLRAAAIGRSEAAGEAVQALHQPVPRAGAR